MYKNKLHISFIATFFFYYRKIKNRSSDTYPPPPISSGIPTANKLLQMRTGGLAENFLTTLNFQGRPR